MAAQNNREFLKQSRVGPQYEKQVLTINPGAHSYHRPDLEKNRMNTAVDRIYRATGKTRIGTNKK